MPPKVSPQTSSPGHTAMVSRVLHKTRISQKGRITTMMREDAPEHGAEIRFRQAGNGDQGTHRVAHAAPGDGRRVGDETHHGGLEGREAESDHHGAGDGNGRAAAARAFQERAEGEGDQQDLEAAVRGDLSDRPLDDFELAGFDRDVVDEDGGDHHPGDTEDAEDHAIGHRAGHHQGGHAEDGEGDYEGRDEGVECGAPRGSAAHGEEIEEGADRYGGGQGGEYGIPQGIEVLQPGLVHLTSTKSDADRNQFIRFHVDGKAPEIEGIKLWEEGRGILR